MLWLLYLIPVALAGTAQVWLTTKDKSQLLVRQADVTLGTCSSPNIVLTYGNLNGIDGFGAAMTDSSAYNLWQLNMSNPSTFNSLMTELFDPNNGIGISFLRVPISASDFALKDYTYDDTAGDTSLKYFSIDHDLTYIIPVLKAAKAKNPSLELMATPWTAPIWMKTSNAWGTGTLQDGMYQTYSNFWIDALTAYQDQGLPFYAFTLQNEPGYEPGSYPGMAMSSGNETNLVKDLGPKIQSAGLKSKLIIYDHNWDNYQYPINVLNDPTARQYISGSAFHCYGGQPSGQNNVHQAYPDKEIYFTECSGTGAPESNTDFGNNLMWAADNLYIGGLTNWARTVLHWNLALDPNYGPTNGGCSNCRGVVTVDYKDNKITRNSEYYNIAMLSKFVKSQANRIKTSSSNTPVTSTAFVNPDGSVVFYGVNDNGSSQTITVQSPGSDGCFRITVPPGLVTVVWHP